MKRIEHRGRSYEQAGDGTVRDSAGRLVELYEGDYRPVLNGDRQGWWRYHEHYDRQGYCDNPARGY